MGHGGGDTGPTARDQDLIVAGLGPGRKSPLGRLDMSDSAARRVLPMPPGPTKVNGGILDRTVADQVAPVHARVQSMGWGKGEDSFSRMKRLGQ
jgi:hypothetical protein